MKRILPIILFSLAVITGCSTIHSSARSGDRDAVQGFLKDGVDINSKNEAGNTPLIIASGYGHTSIVEYLLSKGADVNIKGQNGYTALMFAADQNHDAIVSILIKAGARIEETSTDVMGNTALGISVLGSADKSFKLLLDNGAKIDYINRKNLSIADLAIMNWTRKFEESSLSVLDRMRGRSDGSSGEKIRDEFLRMTSIVTMIKERGGKPSPAVLKKTRDGFSVFKYEMQQQGVGAVVSGYTFPEF